MSLNLPILLPSQTPNLEIIELPATVHQTRGILYNVAGDVSHDLSDHAVLSTTRCADHPQPLQLGIADITQIGRILHTSTLSMEDYMATSPSLQDLLAMGTHIHILEILIHQVNCLRLVVPYTCFIW